MKKQSKSSAGDRAVFLVLVAVAMLVLVFYYWPVKSDIVWMTDFEQAQARAADENKPLLIYFTASWCGPCKQMSRRTWPNDQIEQRVMTSYVPVKIDMSNVNVPNPVAERYRVIGLPTVILAHRNGEPGEAFESYIAAGHLLRYLNEFLESIAPQPGEAAGNA